MNTLENALLILLTVQIIGGIIFALYTFQRVRIQERELESKHHYEISNEFIGYAEFFNGTEKLRKAYRLALESAQKASNCTRLPERKELYKWHMQEIIKKMDALEMREQQ